MDYHGKHEPCLYGWKEGAAHYFVNARNRTTVWEDGEEIDIDKMKKSEMQKLLHDILDDPTPTTVINCPKPQRSADHPTMKPVRLFGYQMANSSRPGDIILDSFGGSGTTIVAAEQLGRKARLMEYDPHYCDVIIARWEKLTGKKAIRI
jgi:site-specific DNA-methyltransferase (adenine-specific)